MFNSSRLRTFVENCLYNIGYKYVLLGLFIKTCYIARLENEYEYILSTKIYYPSLLVEFT